MSVPVRFAWIPLLLALALPVKAGVFDGDALEAVEKLRKEHASRLDRLDAAARGQLELANQLESQRAEIARLRGQVEVLSFELEQAQKRQKDFYVDLDSRMRKLETPPEKPADAAPTEKPAADPAAEADSYQAALTQFKAGKYKEAAAAFRNLIKLYPSGTFISNDHYWGGTAHMQLKEWAKATELFSALVSKWPEDAKAPDALLALANCQQEQGDAKSAKKSMERLITAYPNSSAAETARQKLGAAAPGKKTK